MIFPLPSAVVEGIVWPPVPRKVTYIYVKCGDDRPRIPQVPDQGLVAMILEIGDIVLISHRRMFASDEARFFVGRTIACDRELVKVEGFSFVRDLSNGSIVKKDEKRIKVLSLDSPGYIVYQLPSDISLQNIDIESGDGDAVLKDGARQVMNLSERTHCGHF
jgi:hypothetical protein